MDEKTKKRILLRLLTAKLHMTGAMLTMDAYPKDPNPKNWRTIEGSHVHLSKGKIDGGAGGKFTGRTWTGKVKHEYEEAPAAEPAPTPAPKPGKTPANPAPEKPGISKQEGVSQEMFERAESLYESAMKGPGSWMSEDDYNSFVCEFYNQATPEQLERFFAKHVPITKRFAKRTAEESRSALKRLDPDSANTVRRAQRVMKKYLENSSFGMNVDFDTLSLIAESWFKNQFETGTSHGTLNKQNRRAASNNMFGIPYKQNVPGLAREKYGLVLSSDINNMDGAYQYGACLVRFRKDRLKGRVTYTYDDSLWEAGRGNLIPGDAFNPDVDSMGGISKEFWPDNMEEFVQESRLHKVPPESPSRLTPGRYVELQYHGPLTIADVESIVIDGAKRLTGKKAAFVEKLKAMGIKVYITPDRHTKPRLV